MRLIHFDVGKQFKFWRPTPKNFTPKKNLGHGCVVLWYRLRLPPRSYGQGIGYRHLYDWFVQTNLCFSPEFLGLISRLQCKRVLFLRIIRIWWINKISFLSSKWKLRKSYDISVHGDQIRSWKNRPKCGPTHFWQDYYINLTVEKVEKFGMFLYFSKTTYTKQTIAP
jgi:hypothetical protein